MNDIVEVFRKIDKTHIEYNNILKNENINISITGYKKSIPTEFTYIYSEQDIEIKKIITPNVLNGIIIETIDCPIEYEDIIQKKGYKYIEENIFSFPNNENDPKRYNTNVIKITKNVTIDVVGSTVYKRIYSDHTKYYIYEKNNISSLFHLKETIIVSKNENIMIIEPNLISIYTKEDYQEYIFDISELPPESQLLPIMYKNKSLFDKNMIPKTIFELANYGKLHLEEGLDKIYICLNNDVKLTDLYLDNISKITDLYF